MTLEEYLEKKNIDWQALEQHEHTLWLALRSDFEQMHPNSFEMRKKFMINKIRRKYPKEVYL